MKKLRDFKCESCGKLEQLVEDKTMYVQCKCGNMAARTASAARYFQNTTGRSPSA